MLRVAIPYGLLSTRQLRMLAHIARHYDRGFGHFSTRQNIQFNWPKLEQVPDILAELATVEMHAIQTSGNCIRNVTSDHLAGVAADELEDPRPWCELIRQWSTLHPEFTYLPRKFKIAVTGASDRSRGLRGARRRACTWCAGPSGAVGFEVLVGGGLGRMPDDRQAHPRLAAAARSCSPISRRSCASTTATAAATTSTGRASRCWSRRSASRSLPARSRPSTRPTAIWQRRSARPRPSARLRDSFAPPRVLAAHRHDACARRRRGLRRLVPAQHARAQDRRLSRGVRIAQEARRGAGRHDGGADGGAGRARRPLQLRRSARDARPEPGARRRAAARACASCTRRSRRSASQRPTSARSPT